MLKAEIIDQFDGFLKLEPIWNNLLSQSDLNIPFMTFEWFFCFWQCYSEDMKPFILIVKEDDDILGIAPLMEMKTRYRALPVKAITCFANVHTNRAGFILLRKKKEVVNYIIDYLFNTYRFDIINIYFIEDGSDTDRLLSKTLNEKGIKYRKITSRSSPYILINKDWDSYLKSRSKMFRKGLRRINNLAERNGRYKVKKYTKSDIESGIEEMLKISRGTWKYEENTAIASDRIEIMFYSSLITKMSLKGWLNLWILKIDDEPIAFDLILAYKKKNYSLKTGFVEKYHKLSPSVYLDTTVMKNYFELKDKEFDMLGVKSEYKMRWTHLLREHYGFYYFGNTIYAKMFNFMEFKIINNIKKSAFLTKLFRKIV